MIRTHTVAAVIAAGITLLAVGCSTPSGRAAEAEMAAQYAAQDRFVELFHQSPLRQSVLPPGVGDDTATVDGYAYCDALAHGANDIDATYSLMHDNGLSSEDTKAIAVSARSTLCEYS
jgi:hypothetical protein